MLKKIIIPIICLIVISFCITVKTNEDTFTKPMQITSVEKINTTNNEASKFFSQVIEGTRNIKPVEKVELLTVHYLNVGSADCILVQNKGQNMLIDAGMDYSSKKVINYLKQNNVSKIDILVNTHFHVDHAGGMDDIIKNFNIGKIYLNYHKTYDTPYYNLIKAINAKKLTYTEPKNGTTFKFGDATCVVLNPDGGQYSGGNNYSIVIKMTYDKNTFLFEGDTEGAGERRMLVKKYNLVCDVYKAGHHAIEGSNTTTYLNTIKPKYVVISASKPNSDVLQRLKNTGAKIYVTGNYKDAVVVQSDKNKITFK